jgi:ferredoxin-type protein NapG
MRNFSDCCPLTRLPAYLLTRLPTYPLTHLPASPPYFTLMLMPSESSRRSLLRSAVGDWLERLVAQTESRVIARRYFRPPGAMAEIGFLAACIRCGACIDACPEHALLKVPADGALAAGTPYLEPASIPCIACPTMPCAAACPTPALTAPELGWSGYRLGELELRPEHCVTFRGNSCRICVDACPMGEAALTIDSAGHPVLRREGCVGCGVCLQVCPTSPSSYELTCVEH